jgi:hypothetical protein
MEPLASTAKLRPRWFGAGSVHAQIARAIDLARIAGRQLEEILVK